MVNQTKEIHAEKQKLTELSSTNESKLKQDLNLLTKNESLRIYMIVGEGTVFLILITLGIIKVYRTYKRDTELALQQKNFLLSITHELKSPIASAKLQLQTLQKRELDPETQKKLITNALNDIDRLNALVENVLMSASLDVNDDLLIKENLNLSELILNTLSKNFEDKIKVRLNTSIQEDVFFLADRIAFPSILINLIENAAKYTGNDSPIDVFLKKENNKITLQVGDAGPGIPDDEKLKVFEKFYRSGNEETRKAKGTGLGLFIVKRLVEQHNGTILIKNNNLKGAIFISEFTS